MNWGELAKWQSWVLGVGGSVIAAAVCYVLTWYRRHFKDETARRLEVEALNGKLVHQIDDLKAKLKETTKLQPECILETANKEWGDGNYELANKPIKEWLQHDGVTISKLLTWHADWAVAHAAGDDMRPAGLVAAHSYTRAAIAFWPENSDAMLLLADVKAMMDEDGRPSPSIQEALHDLDRRTSEGTYRHDELGVAEVAEKQAMYYFQLGHFRAALAIIDWALMLGVRNSGRTALRSRQTQFLKAEILSSLGRYKEALTIAQDVARALEANPSLGPNDPQTTVSRNLVAQILSSMGRNEEALTIAKDVAGAEEAHPNHTSTLFSRYLVAQILTLLGRNDEALTIAQDVARALEANPSLGPNHPQTTVSWHLVAQILTLLGRYEEALPIAQGVARTREAHSSLGPNHPQTLSIRYLVAQILNSLGRNEEALTIAKDVARAQDAHPSLGPNHPSTLSSRNLVAQILNSQGRNREALTIAEDVAGAEEAHPSLGPNHPSTLFSRYLVAKILNSLGRDREALPIAQEVARAQEAHPSLGPNHPQTLSNRNLVAEILEKFGRAA
jgi:tetratricopeptide (TPR) repeat protein